MSVKSTTDMNDHEAARLCMTIHAEQLHNLSLIMQTGFMLKTRVGCSLHLFLTEEIGLSDGFIEERIQTIFLDGKPVDDLDSAIVKDGASLALSSAMPGLVGAAMRRGGFYGTLRSSITYQENATPVTPGIGTVHIRLYNLLMKELTEFFLAKGIYVPSSYLAGFLSDQPESFWAGCKVILMNDRSVTKDMLLQDGLQRNKLTYLTVITGT